MVSNRGGWTNLSLFSRICGVTQVTGSCGKTTMGLYKFVIWDAAYCIKKKKKKVIGKETIL